MTKIAFALTCVCLAWINFLTPARAADDATSVVSKAIELTFRESVWIDGESINSVMKNWLRYKRENKAVAMCTDWESQVPKVLAGERYFELIGAGFSSARTKKEQAIEEALKTCEETHKKYFSDLKCQCEHIWTNNEFVYSKQLQEIINSSIDKKADESTTVGSNQAQPQQSIENSEINNPRKSSDPIAKQTRSKLAEVKSICAEIGFEAGTPDYGNCVLKMMDK